MEKYRLVFKQNNLLIDLTNEAISSIRVQNFDTGLRLSTRITEHLSVNLDSIMYVMEELNKDVLLYTFDNLTETLQEVLEVQEVRDYILLADIYEIKLVPLLRAIQETIVCCKDLELNAISSNVEVFLKRYSTMKSCFDLSERNQNILTTNFRLEYTSIGNLTLLGLDNKNQNFYFHSNSDPRGEARALARSWYNPRKNRYIIFGLGLGYHIQELYLLDKSIEILVFEPNQFIVNLAVQYTDIVDVLIKPNVTLCVDPKCIHFTNAISDLDEASTEVLMYYPSVRSVEKKELRDKIEEAFNYVQSVRNTERLLHGNFRINSKICKHNVDELRAEFSGKCIYIVAAGPSLDRNFEQLKQVGKDSIILSTGTVFRKLLTHGIVPDYVIVSDPNERVIAQIRGLEQSEIPMLILSTAYMGFAQEYNGLKYIILQNDFDEAEVLAQKNGHSLYKTGGSVSTIALDVAISLGCARIVFLGLDLSYPGNLVHATETSRREVYATEHLKKTIDINGDEVYTNVPMLRFKKWMEERINNISDIEFIDATEGGARIEGMKNVKLIDVINIDDSGVKS